MLRIFISVFLLIGIAWGIWQRNQPQPVPLCHELLNGQTAINGKPTYSKTLHNYKIPEVVLTNMLGQKRTFSEIINRGNPVLLQFIFTTCPTICPALSNTFANAQDTLLVRHNAFDLISVTIDPTHDTPSQLKAYAEQFGALPPWQFYTGQVKDIIALQNAFDIYRGNKMRHEPITFLRVRKNQPWTRLYGLMTASDLLEEVQLALHDLE